MNSSVLIFNLKDLNHHSGMGLGPVEVPLYLFVLTHDLFPKSLQLFGIML
jgi:hypothetical protein